MQAFKTSPYLLFATHGKSRLAHRRPAYLHSAAVAFWSLFIASSPISSRCLLSRSLILGYFLNAQKWMQKKKKNPDKAGRRSDGETPEGAERLPERRAEEQSRGSFIDRRGDRTENADWMNQVEEM